MIKRNIALLLFLLVPVMMIPAHADSSSGLTVSSNKESYQPGDKVIISGSVPQVVNSNPVTIIVRNPMGNVYAVGQADLLNKLFIHDFVLSDDSMGGTYTVNVKYGTLSGQFNFVLNAGVLTTIPVFDNEIKIRTNGTNLVKYGDVSVSTVDKTVKISMDMSKVTSTSVNQQYQIPKKVVDTPGGLIVLKIDGNQMLCPQSETDTMRILDCSIPANSTELELVGTQVIPEFGPLAGLTILVSVSALVVISHMFRIRF